jgi:hypothetical protein
VYAEVHMGAILIRAPRLVNVAVLMVGGRSLSRADHSQGRRL